jgi:pSer/pThr/pTyr-binding forkhead associated (FHA) protein
MSEQNEELEPQHPAEEAEEALAEPAEARPGAEPIAQLRYIDNSGPTDQLFHVGGKCLIGRHDPAVGEVDVDLTDLAESKFISRKHALIEHEAEAWYLTDQGSSNGTYLYRSGGPDFVKVSEREQIEDGDEIVFANLRFRFEIPPPFEVEPEE